MLVPNIDEMAVLQEGSRIDYQGVLYDFGNKAETTKIEPGVVSQETATNLKIINNILGTEYASDNKYTSVKVI